MCSFKKCRRLGGVEVLRGGGGRPAKWLERMQRERREVKGSSRVMERRQAGAKSIDPAMQSRC
jgi:hypothetical protein